MNRKCSLVRKSVDKFCSLNLLLVILIIIYAFVFFSNYVVSYIETKHFSFTGRPKDSMQIFVIIYGSSTGANSVLGKYLNSQLDSFYISDPFQYIPNTRCANALVGDEGDWLEFYSNCDFKNMEKLVSDKYDKKTIECSGGIQCLAYERLHMFSNMLQCRPENKEITLNLKQPDSFILSAICRKSSLILLLANKLCELENLKPFLRWAEKNKKPIVKVLHVTEDPRSIIHSFIKTLNVSTTLNLKDQARVLCGKMGRNIDFGREFWQNGNSSLVSSYMRVRIEEFQTRPKKIKQNILNFIGEINPTEMKCKLSSSANEISDKELEDEKTLDLRWRKSFTIEEVVSIQTMCQLVFNELSYFHVFYKEDLEDTKNLELF